MTTLIDTEHGFISLASGAGSTLRFQFPSRPGFVSAVTLITVSSSLFSSTGNATAWGLTGDLLGGDPASDADVLTDDMLIVGGRIGGLAGDLVIPFTPHLWFPGRALFRVFNDAGAAASVHITAYSLQEQISQIVWAQLMRRRSWEGE